MPFERRYHQYKQLIDSYLEQFVRDAQPRSLYEPVRYILGGGGKRVRSVLVLIACEAAGGSKRDALLAGVAMELLHNFTLVHDDIMDHAVARRGRKTIHKKWDENTAILVGDELLALAYRALLKTTSPRIHEISRVFTEGVVEVCEGQAYDKDFETQPHVGVHDYLHMIEKKTGKLISVSAELGALIGKGNKRQVTALRRYGEHVGRAFQIQDDLLDITADEKEFGKTIGSDVREGKRTFLYLEALRHVRGSDRKLLLAFARNGGVAKSKVKDFQRIYRETGAIDAARERIAHDLAEAKRELRHLRRTPAREMLQWFTYMLLHRTY
ncbi:MAG: polyprenyl synthetase family protein [Ignavibacteriae bacterium]|nr:polyprenyl synthetase family protein [Ignavibacteriota bacterium]